jgi:nucleotide-binding universal stress UspA family protein
MPSQNPYVIVVGIDFSQISELALERAFEIAATTPGGEPHVIHVPGGEGPKYWLDLQDDIRTVTAAEAADQLERHVRDRIAAFGQTHRERFSRAVTHLRTGTPAEEIAQLASDLQADLVVVGTHGRRALRRLLIGSVAEATVRLTRCPVLVVRPKDHATSQEPQIEPPCPRCVEERRKNDGRELWCAVHRERHGRRHTIHYTDRLSESRENASLLVRT